MSWAVPLAAIALGLGVVCMIGAVLALLLRPERSGAGGQTPAPAFVPAGLPTATALGMEASSEQVLETFGDIPLPDGVRSQQAVGSEQVFSVIVQQPFDRVVAFYQAAMPGHDWAPVGPEPPPAAQSVELQYEKDGRTAAVVITRMPFVGTIVAVTIRLG